MTTLLIALGAFFGYLIAYHTYGRWVAKKIFRLDRNASVPSVELNDNLDYVPTPKTVLFGHHFTSIAGTGPIVGPAIAIMWGWLPALLWVLFGSIFIGAVHDMGSLIVSIRNRGQTVGDIAGRLINIRVRFLFMVALLFALWMVLAIFGLVIANVFTMFPTSILPVFMQIPIAVVIGIYLHRRGVGLLIPSAIALGLMYLTVWFGAGCPGIAWQGGTIGAAVQTINTTMAAWPIWMWVAVLLVYCYIASVLPVWTLLQPRDYINSLQLIASMALIVIGLFVVAFVGVNGKPVEMIAPAVNLHPLNAPPIWPFMFITVACGAISGFHSLVSSGTSSKQLRCETDAQFVGYGSMLCESFLAVLVIVAVAAGIGIGWPNHPQFGGQVGGQLWHSIYHDWNAANAGLGTKIGAFVVGAGNFLESYGMHHTMAVAIMGVLVASFAGTTMDTATRLQRYIIQELSRSVGDIAPSVKPITRISGSVHCSTLLAVVSAFALAIFPRHGELWTWDTIGKGGLILWPMFGTINQLLGGLAFLVIGFWLWRRRKPIWFIAIPMLFMLIMPAWAMLIEVPRWWAENNYLLVTMATVTLILEVWMVTEAMITWPSAKGELEEILPPLHLNANDQPQT